MITAARWRTRRSGLHSSRGAAAVEFAIVLSVLLLILFGIIDFGRLLFVSQTVKSASREGARVASVKATNASIYQAAATAAEPAKSLSGTGTLTVKIDACTTEPCTDTSFTTAVLPATATATGITGTACGPLAPNNKAIKVTVDSSFAWLTPVGAIPGFLIPSLSSPRPVTGSTTMRCEP